MQGLAGSVPLEAIGIELPLAEIYDKVDFAADNPPDPEKNEK